MATTTAIVSGYFQAPGSLAHILEHTKYDDIAAIIAVILASSAYFTKGILWATPDPYRPKLFERPQQLSGLALSKQKHERNIAKRLQQSNANIVIFWASQSGTAERFAGRLARDITRQFNAKVLVLDISDVEPASWAQIPPTTLAIVLASTFGEGDPSDNMHDFWAWLHREDGCSLPNLQYLAFGLGNSKYKHYNQVINVLTTALDAKGAQALMAVGRADDAVGETEENFLEWKDQVLWLLQNHLGYARQEIAYEPSIEIVTDDSLQPADLYCGVQQHRTTTKRSATNSMIYSLPITHSCELFKTGDRSCLHMELDLSTHSELKYKTGDHLGVWPSNPDQEVRLLAQRFGLDQNIMHSLCHVRSLQGDTPMKVPSPTTVRALFTHHLDICAPVSRECVHSLIPFAPTPAAKEFLARISCDKQAYANFLASNYITFGRLLKLACSETGIWRHLPLSLVIEQLPAMQPRYYSISSSSVVHPRSAAITAVVADTPIANTGDRIPGLATNYLLSMHQALSVPSEQPHKQGPSPLTSLPHSQSLPHLPNYIQAHIRQSTFRLPALASAPILLVGAGTGLAPFRAFLQERVRLQHLGREVGLTKLFFGCRNANEDYIYRSELEEAKLQLGNAFELDVSFSRPDVSSGTQKRYVQNAMVDDRKVVVDMLVEKNAYFYICGSAAMARDVSETISGMLRTERDWDEGKVKTFVNQQKRNKRWKQDVWG